MALTIINRPEGYILNPSVFSGGVISSGDAVFVDVAHGLINGDIIYIVSEVEDYNGFFEIEVDTTDGFFALYIGTSTRVAFIAAVDFEYQVSDLTHGWSAIHLPITYKISNDLYPVNSVDTARTITSLSDYLGFARIGLSGSLGTFEDLSFVKIAGASDSDLNGVWQVIDKISTSSVILNIAYSSLNGAGILGATMQLYYGNYNVVVRVYAGINASHEWTAQKPYELAATLELIPDENNEVFFSVNDILKAYVKTENNLLLGTLPNNIDAWTNFYVSIAEAYDTSNGYTITTNETSFTSDQSTFEGTAVNAMLAFKNIYSGYLSEYLMINLMTNNTAKFLTLFTIPVLFSCGDDTPECYQDISFINPSLQELKIKKEFYINDVLMSTVIDDIGTIDAGIIRSELEADCTYDRVDISVVEELGMQNGDFQDSLDPSTSEGAGASWEWTAAYDGAAESSNSAVIGEPTPRLIMPLSIKSGVNYEFEISLIILDNGAGAGPFTDLKLYLTDGVDFSNSVTQANLDLNSTPGDLVFNLELTANQDWDFVEITLEANAAGGIIRSFVILSVVLVDPTTIEISETKQFKIDCGCADQEIRLSWMNNLGGFDYWSFTAQTGHTVDITQVGETKKNIFPNWPKSYGANADTIRKQTMRQSMVKKFVVSQELTRDEADAIAYIKSSPLVQIINSRFDRRTVIVDTDSFLKYTDGDKIFTISFNITYTDDIPSQTV